MKKLASLILMIVLSFAVVACGNTSANDYSKYSEDGRLILTIWAPDQYAGKQVSKQFQSWLDEFNETQELKDIGIYLQFSSMTQLPTSLGTACLSGPHKMPDIVVWDRFATPSNTKLLLPINNLIEEDNIDSTKFFAETYEELNVDGKQYGLPLDADPWGLYINMDMVNEYNATATEDDKIDVNDLGTWTKVMKAADKLTIRDGNNVTRSGINTTSADGQFFSFVYTGGGELIDTDKNSPSYGDTVMAEDVGFLQDAQSLRVYDTLALFNELYDMNLCNTGHGGTDAFGNNLLGITYGSIYFPQELSVYRLKNYKMLLYPARDRTYVNGEDKPQMIDPSTEDSLGMVNGQVGGMLGGYGLVIPQPTNVAMRTKEWQNHVDKAWEVIKLWMTNDTINELYFTTNKAITCRQDLWDNEFYQQDGIIKDILPYLENYKMRPSVAGYEMFESSVVRTQIQALRERQLTVFETYKTICEQGNPLLRKLHRGGHKNAYFKQKIIT